MGTVTDARLKNTGSSKSVLNQYKTSYVFRCYGLAMVLILQILDVLFDQHSLATQSLSYETKIGKWKH